MAINSLKWLEREGREIRREKREQDGDGSMIFAGQTEPLVWKRSTGRSGMGWGHTVKQRGREDTERALVRGDERRC